MTGIDRPDSARSTFTHSTGIDRRNPELFNIGHKNEGLQVVLVS